MSVSPEYPLDEIADDWYWGIGEVVGEYKTFPFHKGDEYRGKVHTDKYQDWTVELERITVDENGITHREMLHYRIFVNYEDAMEYVTDLSEKYNNE